MPLELECITCGATFEADITETFVHVYQEPHFNHIHTYCVLCKSPFYLFFEDKRFLQLGYPLMLHEQVDDNIRDIRSQCDNPPQTLHDDPDAIMDAVVEHNFHDWLEHVNPSDF